MDNETLQYLFNKYVDAYQNAQSEVSKLRDRLSKSYSKISSFEEIELINESLEEIELIKESLKLAYDNLHRVEYCFVSFIFENRDHIKFE